MRVLLQNPRKQLIGGVGHHIVAGGITGGEFQPQIDQIGYHLAVHIDQLGETAGTSHHFVHLYQSTFQAI